jgi:hypothetical protein
VIDVAAMAVGAAIFASGVLAGRITPRRRPAARDGATCDCGHLYATRDAETGRCTAEVRRAYYLATGDRNGWEWVACPCADHTSPEQRIQEWTPRQITDSEQQ